MLYLHCEIAEWILVYVFPVSENQNLKKNKPYKGINENTHATNNFM